MFQASQPVALIAAALGSFLSSATIYRVAICVPWVLQMPWQRNQTRSPEPHHHSTGRAGHKDWNSRPTRLQRYPLQTQGWACREQIRVSFGWLRRAKRILASSFLFQPCDACSSPGYKLVLLGLSYASSQLLKIKCCSFTEPRKLPRKTHKIE